MIFIVFSLIRIGVDGQIIVKNRNTQIQYECYSLLTQLKGYANSDDLRDEDERHSYIFNEEQDEFKSAESLDVFQDICQQDLMKICDKFFQEQTYLNKHHGLINQEQLSGILQGNTISRCLSQKDLSIKHQLTNNHEIKIIVEQLQLQQQSQKFQLLVDKVKDISKLQYRILYFESFYDFVNHNFQKSIIITQFQNENYFDLNFIPLFQEHNYFIAQIRDTDGNIFTQGFVLPKSNQQYNYCQNYQNQDILEQIFELLALLKGQAFNQMCKGYVDYKYQQLQEQVQMNNDPQQTYLIQLAYQYSIQFQILSKNIQIESFGRLLAAQTDDFDYYNKMVNNFKKLSQKLIIENNKLLATIGFLEDVGDPDTQDQLNINHFQRYQLFEQIDFVFNQIKILSNEQQNNLIIQILAIIRNITESFQDNIMINSPRLRYKGDNYKINIIKMDYDKFKNIIGVKNVDEEMSLVMKNTEIRVQIHQFNRNFYNLTNILQLNADKKMQNETEYEVPELQNMTIYFTDITNKFKDGQQIKIEELPLGSISYKMQSKQDIQNFSDYQFRCYSKIDDFWYFDKCQYEEADENNSTSQYCVCSNTHPVTLVGIKKYNKTNMVESQKQNSILEQQKQKIWMFPLFYILINEYCLFIFVSALVLRLQLKETTKPSKFMIELAEIQEDVTQLKNEFTIKPIQSPEHIVSFNQDISFKPPSSPPVGLNLSSTLAQSPERLKSPTGGILLSQNYLIIDFQFIKTHYSSIHELTAVVKGFDRYFCPFQKLILLLTNLSFVFDTCIVTYWLLPYLKIIPLVIIFSTLLQVVTKIFGSLFTTRILKPIAYIFLICFNSLSFLVVVLPGTLIQEDGNTELVIIYVVCLIIQYTVIESIIIIIKIYGLKEITDEMYRDQMNPLLHFVYFFLKNDTLEQIYEQCNR